MRRPRAKRGLADAGVWESDGADGYVCLVVLASSGKLLLRVEISAAVYSTTWVLWLERWLRRHDMGFLRVIH